MDALDLLKFALQSKGYDGLYNTDGDCACETDDLAPCCDGLSKECEAGYKVNKLPKGYEDLSYLNCDWYIIKEKLPLTQEPTELRLTTKEERHGTDG